MTSMAEKRRTLRVLVAEDSEFDRTLLREAFDELAFDVHLIFVGHGEELFDYLRRNNEYASLQPGPLPALILMDLNMPRMKGLEALRQLRADATLRALPVIVLSTSSDPRQVAQVYACGGNSYMIKPQQFGEMLVLLQKFGDFWLRVSQLPDPRVLAE